MRIRALALVGAVACISAERADAQQVAAAPTPPLPPVVAVPVPPLGTAPALRPLSTQRSGSGAGDRAKLERAAAQLEGLLTFQMLKAMRANVNPGDGALPASSAETIFTDLLDQAVADQQRPVRSRGLAASVLRTFDAAVTSEGATAPTTVHPTRTGLPLHSRPMSVATRGFPLLPPRRLKPLPPSMPTVVPRQAAAPPATH